MKIKKVMFYFFLLIDRYFLKIFNLGKLFRIEGIFFLEFSGLDKWLCYCNNQLKNIKHDLLLRFPKYWYIIYKCFCLLVSHFVISQIFSLKFETFDRYRNRKLSQNNWSHFNPISSFIKHLVLYWGYDKGKSISLNSW